MQERLYESREDLQAAALTAWLPTKKGTLVLSTGVGKSFVGITAACGQIRRKLISTCLIVVPTTNLILQWEQEILRWNYTLEGITIKCLQTAYKEKSKYDLLIIDEVHTATGDEYSKVFTNTQYTQCLGLSATVDENNPILEKYCPVLFSSKIKDALNAKAFNPYTIYNTEVTLSKRERAIYNTFDKQFKLSKFKLAILKKDYPEFKDLTIFDIAKRLSTSKDKSEITKYSKMFWSAMSLRKTLCYNTYSKALIAAELVNDSPKDKWIIFTMSIKLAEALALLIPTAKVYHSKQKTEDRTRILEEYANSEFTCLITVQALDAGLNIPDISKAISLSGTSSELTAAQRLGRIARIKPIASTFINLYSKDTIEKSWLEKRNKNIENVKWVTLSSLKTILKDGSR